LERVRYAQPDLILLDVLMPGIDGFETCRRLKANAATRDIPVLFLSALDEAIDKVRGFADGGVDYITKPLQVIEVLARIRTHLTLRQLRQALQQQNELLEERVLARTAQLQAEIERRQQQEEERHKLLNILTQQSDQLRNLTTLLLEHNQENHRALAHSMTTQMKERAQQLHHQLAIIEALTSTHQNTTERYQLTVQLQQLRATVEQIDTDRQAVATERHQFPKTIQRALNDPLLKLSAREREVLQLVVEGKSNAQIAELLYLSETTVRTHRSRLLQKLELEDTMALVKFAIQHHLIAL
jgi:DNA-binding NarL/FixJ family response regulator